MFNVIFNKFIAFAAVSVTVHTKKVIFIFSMLIVFLGIQLSSLRIDSTIEGFLSPDSPELLKYNEFKDLFGRDEFFLFALETENLYDLKFINGLKLLHTDLLQKTPYVATVDSLVNARNIFSQNDELIIDELLDKLPYETDGLQKLRSAIENNPLYTNAYLSADRTLLCFIIKLQPFHIINNAVNSSEKQQLKNLDDKEIAEAMSALEKIKSDYGWLSKKIIISGSPAVTAELSRNMATDFGVYSGLAILLVTLFLFVIFRRISGIMMPMIALISSVVCALGLMALKGDPLQLTTTMLPSFLLAACVGDSVHLLNLFYKHYDKGTAKRDAINLALKHAGIPMIYTSLTTAFGLLSFATSNLFPVFSLGLFGAIGTMLALIFTLFFIPALLIVMPLKRRETEIVRKYSLDKFTQYCTALVLSHPVKIVTISFFVLVLSIVAATNINFTHDALNWFKDDAQIKHSIKFTESKIGGSMPAEILIDSGRSQGVSDPVFLARLDNLVYRIKNYRTETMKVGNAVGLSDLIKETNKAMHNNDSLFYSIPTDQALIAQELLLIEMSKASELHHYSDSDLRFARVTVLHPWTNSIHHAAFIQDLKNITLEIMGKEYSANVTGLTTLLGETFAQMLATTAQSYIFAGITISILMILLLDNVLLGLVSMLPNLLPIAATLGLMATLGAPLDMFSMLIGSIALGLAVDDTIHFMYGFNHSYKQNQDYALAIKQTMDTNGQAMVVTSLILSLSFLIYCFSEMNNLWDFGIYTSFCIILALIADLLFSPALLCLIYRKKTLAYPSLELQTNYSHEDALPD